MQKHKKIINDSDMEVKMGRLNILLCSIVVLSVLFFSGCSTSEESTSKEGEKIIPPQDTVHTAVKPEMKKEEKTDTVNIVDAQKTQKPPYQQTEISKPPEQEVPAGNYAVQVGAFKSKESAERFAELPKERFPGRIIIVPDEDNQMFKVLIGYFRAKEEARAFRDEINQKYPAEYKDAWVTEIKK